MPGSGVNASPGLQEARSGSWGRSRGVCTFPGGLGGLRIRPRGSGRSWGVSGREKASQTAVAAREARSWCGLA